MKILLGTKNTGKIREIRRIFSELNGFEWLTFAERPFDEVLEDGRTFLENASKKASQISLETHLAVIAEDSGLEVEALQGAPGIRSARFASDGATDTQNITKLLELLGSANHRRARFVCVAVLALPDGRKWHTRGTLDGRIAETARGTMGFGYDPVFIPSNYEQTLGELGAEIKDRISHRAQALEQLKIYLTGLIQT